MLSIRVGVVTSVPGCHRQLGFLETLTKLYLKNHAATWTVLCKSQCGHETISMSTGVSRKKIDYLEE